MIDPRSALALTFDNLGEAADLERGRWPAGAPLGRHPSVTEVLPRLLDELDGLGLRATFCVEALNCELYPDAVAGIQRRGHELACHGWRHEAWSGLAADREDELLGRIRRAFAALGADVRGFRPPGGETTVHSARLLAAHGFAWISAAGDGRGRRGPLASVPFRWELVDALHRLASFAARRRAVLGADPGPLDPAATAERLLHALGAGAGTTLVLHPFLMADERGMAAARRVLRGVRALADESGVRVATVREIADGLA